MGGAIQMLLPSYCVTNILSNHTICQAYDLKQTILKTRATGTWDFQALGSISCCKSGQAHLSIGEHPYGLTF